LEHILQNDRTELAGLASSFLNLHKFFDYGPMGLQHIGDDEIKGVASAVSVTRNVIEKAADAGANLLVVHHGLYWNTEPREVDARLQGRIELLDKYGMTLLAYHLALDAHPIIGNNILALKGMGAVDHKPFQEIGWGGRIKDYAAGMDVLEKIADMYPTKDVKYFAYGPWPIKKVCVITGGGGNYIHDAVKEGYDLFLTGEAEEPSAALAAELGIHFIAAGHYQTEKAGVDKLGSYLASAAKVPYRFILEDNPV
jgi:dinuclear metal center YbgI/SA1388 family protein